MKIAWMCWFDEGDKPIIVFEEPENWYYAKIVQIVYAEVAK